MAANADAQTNFRQRILRKSVLGEAAAEDIEELARVAKTAAFPRGRTLAKAESAPAIFIIDSGVAAELHEESESDRAILVSLAGPGDIAGAVSALNAQHKPGRRMEALSNVSALTIPAADFFRICRRNPELSMALMQMLARQENALADIFVASTHHSLETRLAAFFARVVALSAREDWSPSVNVGRLSQSAVAGMLGVSREHVNRTLSMWERSGLIFQNKSGDILVQNARRLHALADAGGERRGIERQEDWLWEIDVHLDRGLNQTALHLALEAAKRSPKDSRYAHRAVLATARLGAMSEALALLKAHKLDRKTDDEDIASLRARLLRDLAYAENPDDPDLEKLTSSAKLYAEIFDYTQGFYSGVNAAAGYALLGDDRAARSIAKSVSKAIAAADDEDDDTYWRRTTLAECKLLEGNAAAAASLFEAAAGAEDATPGKKATTRKQLRRLGAHVGVDNDWIDSAVPQPAVLYYCGPLARGEDSPENIPSTGLLDALQQRLKTEPVGWAYGALASGADIIIAEALIEAGVSLNVYLPLPPADFLKSSVDIGGPDWRERFITCMRAADSVEWTRRTEKPCDAAYRLGAEITMGKAVRHAMQLETRATGFFSIQENRDEATSLSIANRNQWKSLQLPFSDIEAAWPQNTAAAGRLEKGHAVFYAAIFERAPAKPVTEAGAKASFHTRNDREGLDLFFYKKLEEALSAAQDFFKRSKTSSACCWLDAGIFEAETLRARPQSAFKALVAGACRPQTEPGDAYATEAFASLAPLAPDHSASFDYVGFVPTREKLDPCALYLVRFREPPAV